MSPLMYMDNINIFAKNEKEQETHIQTISHADDTRMKRGATEGIKLTNMKNTWRKRKKILIFLEADTIKQI